MAFAPCAVSLPGTECSMPRRAAGVAPLERTASCCRFRSFRALVPLGLGGSFVKPTTLAQDRLGALFVTTLELGIEGQRVGRALAKLHPDGRVGLFAGDLDRPQGMAFDQAGHLYLADGASGRI